ncbi:hypothetical protein JK208_05350 [Gluconobacter sp. Dm-74]|uniref:hypothetical protein n=1 Tax=Gluconobacter sp. Dm-74 TaxID=2799803 RepID=UPI001B8C499E|nr:hypothetical protein [Gluconobacter sp. Dm-74]MBS1091031.1 hypothetical protein [Gluconobacter sp. Dm-74]
MMFNFFINESPWYIQVIFIIVCLCYLIIFSVILAFVSIHTIKKIETCSEYVCFGGEQYKVRKKLQCEYDKKWSKFQDEKTLDATQITTLKAQWDMENARMLRTFSVVGGFVALIALSSSIYSTITAYKSFLLAHPQNIYQVKSALIEDYKTSLRAESVKKLKECLSHYSVPSKNACIDREATHYEDQEKLLNQNQ